jgi:hypothetical protein
LNGGDLGLIGGIAGGVIGIMGGIIGTYFGIKNTSGPRERAFAIRYAGLCWLGIAAFLALLFLIPMPWGSLLWVVYLPCLFWSIRWSNERQALARLEDSREVDRPGDRDVGA